MVGVSSVQVRFFFASQMRRDKGRDGGRWGPGVCPRPVASVQNTTMTRTSITLCLIQPCRVSDAHDAVPKDVVGLLFGNVGVVRTCYHVAHSYKLVRVGMA